MIGMPQSNSSTIEKVLHQFQCLAEEKKQSKTTQTLKSLIWKKRLLYPNIPRLFFSYTLGLPI